MIQLEFWVVVKAEVFMTFTEVLVISLSGSNAEIAFLKIWNQICSDAYLRLMLYF